MGRVTVFVTHHCTFCRTVETCVHKAMVELRKEDPELRLVLTVVDVSRNPARARQCIRLTRSRTVPHVFFNEEYVGNSTSVCRLLDSGKLRDRLRELGREPTVLFPSPTKASMIKVTEETAFASQPTMEQVMQLAPFGFRSLVCVRPIACVGACFHCREMCSACRSGVAFHYAPIASAKALEGSAQNFLRILYAVASLQAAPKPALVHCDEGTYASFVVLLHAAWRSRRGPRRLARWARDLRQDYPRHAPTLKAWSKPLCRIFQFVGPPPADSESPPAAPPTTPPTLHSGHPCHAAQDQPPASHLPSALKPRVEAPDSLHGVPLSDAS